MRRLLGGLLLGTAALTTVPAQAAPPLYVRPHVWVTEDRVGVGAEYGRDGQNYDPVGAAYVDPSDARACVGFSYQIPLCAEVGPIEIVEP